MIQKKPLVPLKMRLQLLIRHLKKLKQKQKSKAKKKPSLYDGHTKVKHELVNHDKSACKD